MKKLLLTITVSLAAFAIAHAQYSQYGVVENFYQRNPDLDNNQYAGRAVNPSYWLVNRNQWGEMDSRLIADGYVRLGISNWQSSNLGGGGIPQRDLAIAYARIIGADVVIYADYAATNISDGSEHSVGFYAKQSARRATPASTARPSNAEASLAINRLQDALGKPHIRGGVWYDPRTDTYNWIGPKFGRRMSEPASQFLSEVGPYLY
jgi:hypothetical protein